MKIRSAPTSGADRAQAYCDAVLSGEIKACKWVRLACQRHVRDRKRKRFAYEFDADRANHAINFIEALPHVKGREFAGKRLILSGWQCFVTACVFGWIDKRTKLRRFRTVYIEVPRKNGKSSWSAGVALYMLVADGEVGAEVYSAATTRDQARIVWETAKRMVERTPALRATGGVTAGAHAIFVEAQGSTFKALSRDQQGNLDGLNIACAIVDELHGHKDRGIWDVIETATGARAQPLVWAITTAGSNRAGICYEQQAYVRKILQGVVTDHTYFGIVYTLDEKDDWNTPEAWAKANPNYDVSVSPLDIARKARKASEMAAAQNNFLTKHLDVWVNADTAWMNMRAWDRCGDARLDEAQFEGMDCNIGLDLATKVDLAAKVRLFARNLEISGRVERHYYAFGRYYLPEEAAEDGRNSQYSGWIREGLVVATPGNVTDYSYIEDDLRADAARFHVIDVAVDPWQASQLSQRMQAEGLPMVTLRQTVENMSEPMKELERLVLQGRFHFCADDAALTWMVSNVVAHLDIKENIYPRKERAENKIDGVIALIMALARSLAAGVSVYERRGVLTVS